MPRDVAERMPSAPRRVNLGAGFILTGASEWREIDMAFTALSARGCAEWLTRAPAKVAMVTPGDAHIWQAARRIAYLAIRAAEGRLRPSQRAEYEDMCWARYEMTVSDMLDSMGYTPENFANSLFSSYLSYAVEAMRNRDRWRVQVALARSSRRISREVQKVVVPWEGNALQLRHLIIGQGRMLRRVGRGSRITRGEVERYERLRAALVAYWVQDPSRMPKRDALLSWQATIIGGRDIGFLAERRRVLSMPPISHVRAPELVH